jgi:hypothetical protein
MKSIARMLVAALVVAKFAGLAFATLCTSAQTQLEPESGDLQ